MDYMQRARGNDRPCEYDREGAADATGSARRCEPPPHPARAGLDKRDRDSGLPAAGPRGSCDGQLPHETLAAAMARHAERTVAQAAPEVQWPGKVVRGRRRFAPAKPAGRTDVFVGRRDENVDAAAPLGGEADGGERTHAPGPSAAVRPANGETSVETTPRGVLAISIGYHQARRRSLHVGRAKAA